MSDTASCKQSTWFELHNEELANLAGRISIYVSRLEALAVRVIGPRPEGQDEPKEEKQKPEALVAKADDQADRIRAALDYLDPIIDSLERLG